MNLYEINQEITALLERLEPDPETGEVADMADIAADLEELAGERDKKLEGFAKSYFEAKANAEQLKAEKMRLAEKQRVAENKAERILNFLAFIADGQKTDCGIATLSFPKPRAALKTDDATAAAEWLTANGHPDLFTTPAPTIDAKEVKKLVLDGAEIPGVHLEYKQGVTLK